MVVVSKPDLVNNRGVIFVDDGNDMILKQAAQRVPGIQEPPAVLQVAVRQQHLGNAHIELPEEALIQSHETYLADCCCRLFQGNEPGPLSEAQFAHAGSNRAGRNQYKIAPALSCPGNGCGDIGKYFPVQIPPGSGQNITPELYDRALYLL
jgi:hypothetical protein